MSLSRNGHAAVLLLAVSQSLVFASTSHENNRTEAWAKAIVSSAQVPWIKGIHSAISSSGSSCAEEVAALSEAMDARETWALEMLDASSKIQSGILQGNVVDLGMYSQCVAVEGNYKNVNVRGKHCIVTLRFETLTLTSSVCIPSSCDETQATDVVTSTVKHFLVNGSSGIEIIEVAAAMCARLRSEEFSVEEILTIGFFSAVGAFIIACTICDFARRNWPQKNSAVALNTLAKFSLYTNALAILNTEVKPGTISAINGIRFLSTCWIVVWHRYLYSIAEPLVNTSDWWQWSNSWNAVWLQMSTFATDNFFLVSGFLMSYLFFKSMRSGRKLNLPMMYLHRYIRLTPCIAVVTLFVTFLSHRIGNGPLWKIFSSLLVDDCRKNWWVNFLYIQNILRPRNICLEYSWFLAADMQLFWISPIILYPLHRWPKYGLGVLSLFILASVVTPAVVVWLKGYVIVVRPFDSRDSFYYYYIQPYTRAFPYLLGILSGYDIAFTKRHFSQVTVAFNWLLTCVFLILCSFAIHYLFNIDIGQDPDFEITCAAILRPCWSIAMVWIIYACSQGYGGVLASFLSLPIFLPLSRLSYGIYLVHIIIRILRMGTSVIPGIFLDSELLNSYLGELILSIGVSAVISLFFEWPVMVLEKVLKNGARKSEQASAMQDGEHTADRGILNEAVTEA